MMTKFEDADYRPLVVIFSILAVGFCFGCMVGSGLASQQFQREAVASGHAEYTTNERGSAVWRWKVIGAEDK